MPLLWGHQVEFFFPSFQIPHGLEFRNNHALLSTPARSVQCGYLGSWAVHFLCNSLHRYTIPASSFARIRDGMGAPGIARLGCGVRYCAGGDGVPPG